MTIIFKHSLDQHRSSSLQFSQDSDDSAFLKKEQNAETDRFL